MRLANVFKIGALVVVIAQFPFVFRVCSSYRLNRYIENLPQAAGTETPFRDLRGSLHIHSAAGSHSMGTYHDIIEAARQAKYQWLLITDHPKEYVLFNQITDPDLVVIYGVEEERPDGGRNLRDSDGKFKVFSYLPANEVPDDVAAMEIFNLADSGRTHNNPIGWFTWAYHRLTFPELFFFHFLELDPELLSIWDQASSRRPLSATAGNNAHQNVGLILVSGAGKRLASLFVDPYELSFRFVSNHLQLPYNSEVNQETVLGALAGGASYICFERLADPTGFSFHAIDGERTFPMGSKVEKGSTLVGQSPYSARFRLLRAGREVSVVEGTSMRFEAVEPGNYRVEVYLADAPPLIEGKPWILSNPIYVGAPQ